MNKVFSTVWCAIRNCFVVTNEFSRRRGKSARAVVLSALATSGLMCIAGSFALNAQAAEMTSPVLTQPVTPIAAADISTTPNQGVSEMSGRAGYYSCDQMTWGIACAKIGYSFGTFTTFNGANGGDALTSGTYTNITTDLPQHVSVVDYNPGTLASDGFTVTVTQIAATVDSKIINSTTTLATSAYVNGGAAFRIEGVAQDSTPFSLDFTETSNGSGGVTGGVTLQEAVDAFNAHSSANNLGLTASAVEDPDNLGHFALSVKGISGDTGTFTFLTVDTSIIILSGTPPLAFDPIDTTTEQVLAQYVVSGAASGNGTLSSMSNTITVDGVTISLVAPGAAALTTTTINAGVGPATNGNAGVVGTGITGPYSFTSIAVPGSTAFSLQTTGGNAGQAGMGGMGGNGGKGGDAVTGTVCNGPINCDT